MTQPSVDPQPATSDPADDISKHQIDRRTPAIATADLPDSAERMRHVQRELAKRRAIDRAREKSVDNGLSLDAAL